MNYYVLLDNYYVIIPVHKQKIAFDPCTEISWNICHTFLVGKYWGGGIGRWSICASSDVDNL